MSTVEVYIEAFKTESTLGRKFFLEWDLKILRTMTVPFQTPVFSTLKDAEFCFEVCYSSHKSADIISRSHKVVLRKIKSPVNSDLKLGLYVSFDNSYDGLKKEYKSSNFINVNDFVALSCIDGTKRVKCNIFVPFSGAKSKLKCEMFFYGHMLSPESYCSELESLHNLRELTKGFESLFVSNAFSDVSVQIGDKTLHSHKFVLAASSPVFKRMLEQDFLETKTGVINISDFEPELFESFLKYLYTTEMEKQSFTGIQQLYSLADKYEVQILKRECIKMWKDSNLSEEEVFEIRKMARDYKDSDLIEAANSLLVNHFSSLRS